MALGNNDPNEVKLAGLYSFTQPKLGNRVARLETGSQRTRRFGLQPSAGQYGRTPVDALDAFSKSQLATYNTAQSKFGSVAPTTNRSGFAYTATDHSISWFWDNTNGSMRIVLHRADKSVFVIPITGSGLTISGLTASTTYNFLPFWSPLQGCTVGWVLGTVGTPQIAFTVANTTDNVIAPQAIIQQNYQDREPITAGFMSAATAAGGGSGGGGGGGGGTGGRCVMAGTDIETLGAIEYQCEVHPESNWLKITVIDGRHLACTVDHPLFESTMGRIEAQQVHVGDLLIMDNGERAVASVEPLMRVCSKWEVKMPDGHLYWANGFLSHNQKANPN